MGRRDKASSKVGSGLEAKMNSEKTDLRAAAEAARQLLSKLTGRIEIDDRLREEVRHAEELLWAALMKEKKT